MLIYLLLIIAAVLFFRTMKEERALLLSFVLMSLIAALRSPDVGIDTQQFYNAFYVIGKSSSLGSFRFEFGFTLLCKILYLLFGNGQSLIVFTSVFINFSVYLFIKKHSKNCFQSALLYIFMNLFFNYMNIMRQAMAIAVLLLGYDLLRDKKYFSYLIVVLIASQFHISALLAIGLIALKMIRFNKKSMISLTIAGIIVFALLNQIFDLLILLFPKYSSYKDSIYASGNLFGSLLDFMMNFFIVALLILANRTFEKSEENALSEETNFYTLTMIVYLIFLSFIIRINIFNRLSPILGIYLIVYVPNTIRQIKEENESAGKRCQYVVFAIALASFIVINLYRPEWTGAIPYTFFWN